MLLLVSIGLTSAAPPAAGPAVQCSWGDALACGSETRSPAVLQRACDGGDAGACVTVAIHPARGSGDDPARGLAVLDAACRAGHPAACGNAAFHHREGRGTAPDLDRAFALYQQSCERGHAPSCCEVAAAHRWGRGTPLDPDASFQTYAAQCVAGAACGCHGVALRELEGRGTSRDEASAIARLSELCDGEYAESCVELGEIHVDRDEIERATERLRRACDLGSGEGCRRLAYVIDAPDRVDQWRSLCDEGYARACLDVARELQERDEARAAHRLRERACALGLPQGCRLVGRDFARGDGVAADSFSAVTGYERGAALGSRPSMRFLGRRALRGDGMSVDEALAVEWMQRACALEDVPACDDVAVSHLEGRLFPPTVEAAMAPLWALCERDPPDDEACAAIADRLTPMQGRLAFGHPATRDPRVTAAARRGCGADDAAACRSLAIRLHIGLDGTVDDAAAAVAASRACGLGDVFGCSRLAWHLDHGAGVPMDRERAEALFRAACDDEDYEIACWQLQVRPWLSWILGR